MKNKRRTLSVLFCLGIGLATVNAQESSVASGGDASGVGGTVSYSVGQVVYTTNSSASGTISQGVQQPYEILIVTGINEAVDVTMNLTAYPNPTTDFLILKISDYDLKNVSYQFYDINGKLIENKKINDSETNIVMDKLASSTYFLKVSNGNTELKSFKIIKN